MPRSTSGNNTKKASKAVTTKSSQKAAKVQNSGSSLFASQSTGSEILNRLKMEREMIRGNMINDNLDSDSDIDIYSSRSDISFEDGADSDDYVSYYRNELDEMDKNMESRAEYFQEYATDRMVGGEIRRNRDEESNMRELGRNKPNVDEVDEYIEADLKDRTVPLVSEIKLDDKTTDISKAEPYPVTHQGIDYPKFDKGFFHWIHSAKNKAEEALEKFEGKKKVYLVVSGYEPNIDDLSTSVEETAKTYFKLSKGENIASRSFYNVWEILNYLDLIDISNAAFTSAHINETGGALQAVMFFRDRYSKNAKKDSYLAASGPVESSLGNNLSTLKDGRIQIVKNNQDKFGTATVKSLIGATKGGVDLITADGGVDWNDENIQEQESAYLVFASIVAAVHMQKKGGAFVLRMYEMFTDLSLKFIAILKYFYQNVYVIKPLMSLDLSSERFIVCTGFKFEGKSIKNVLDSLMSALSSVEYTNDSRSADTDFLVDVYPSITITSELKYQITSINTSILNEQYKVINKTVAFIDGSNYHGDSYRQYRERQIRLSDHWITSFFPDTTKKDEAVERAHDLLTQSEKIEINRSTQIMKGLSNFVIPTKTTVPRKTARPTTKTAKKTPVAKVTKAKAKSKSKSKSTSKTDNKKSVSKTAVRSRTKAKKSTRT